MKNKYLIGILCVCVLISATGCGSDADVNAQTADNIEIEDSVETEVYAGTLAALSEDDQEEDTEGRDEEESIVSEGEEYSNPIDAYFLPRIESAS